MAVPRFQRVSIIESKPILLSFLFLASIGSDAPDFCPVAPPPDEISPFSAGMGDAQHVVTSVSISMVADGDADACIFTTMSIEYKREPVSHASASNSGGNDFPRIP